VRTRALLIASIVALAAVLAVGGLTRMTSASFTDGLTTSGNSFTVDRLSNHFAVTPGSSATGNVDSLAINLGFVASPQTVTNVFTVRNVSSVSRTATLIVLGPSQLSSATFAQSGSSSVTLAPGASSAVSLTTSPTMAGRGTGNIRLKLGNSTWLYRDYSVTLDNAPATPASLTATAIAAADIRVDWPASTTTNVAGYDVYRSTGGSWTKRNTSLVTGTSWTDTSPTNGTQYSYRVRAVSSGTPSFESVDSPTATARADSTAPTRPSAVALANGGGTGNAYINLANRASVSVTVTLPSTSVSTDVVTVTISRNSTSVSKSAPATNGAGTVTITGIDATSVQDGSVTTAATASDAAGNTSSTRSVTATKDTAAPNAPTAIYEDRDDQADRINGTCEASATITATRTVPSAAGPYTATATTGGTYTVTVARVDGQTWNPITVTYLVTARDAAGNTSAATTLTYNVTR
jgi:Big-like domain-containing protein